MQTDALEGGFANPALDAARAFRGLMDVMARPGTIREVAGALPPAPLSLAAGTVLLTLCDPDTPVFLSGAHDCTPVRDWIRFHTGAPVSSPEDCAFAVGIWDDLPALGVFQMGTAEYPDRSATLIVECERLAPKGAILSGPGIRETAQLSLPDVAGFQINHSRFPLGLDFFLTSGNHVAALSRAVRVDAAPAVQEAH